MDLLIRRTSKQKESSHVLREPVSRRPRLKVGLPPVIEGAWRSQTHSATVWAHIQPFKSANPNAYSIYRLLDLDEELALQNQI